MSLPGYLKKLGLVPDRFLWMKTGLEIVWFWLGVSVLDIIKYERLIGERG
jgi:hypothetical protein